MHDETEKYKAANDGVGVTPSGSAFHALRSPGKK